MAQFIPSYGIYYSLIAISYKSFRASGIWNLVVTKEDRNSRKLKLKKTQNMRCEV